MTGEGTSESLLALVMATRGFKDLCVVSIFSSKPTSTSLELSGPIEKNEDAESDPITAHAATILLLSAPSKKVLPGLSEAKGELCEGLSDPNRVLGFKIGKLLTLSSWKSIMTAPERKSLSGGGGQRSSTRTIGNDKEIRTCGPPLIWR